MHYVGIDLHKQDLVMAVEDERGMGGTSTGMGRNYFHPGASKPLRRKNPCDLFFCYPQS